MIKLGQMVRDGVSELTKLLDVKRVAADSAEVLVPESRTEPSGRMSEKADQLGEAFRKLDEEKEFYRKRSVAYFDLIHQMELQREGWKQLYLNDGRAHQQAQAMLENALESARESFKKCLEVLNVEREARGLPPFTNIIDVKAEPIGTAQRTTERLTAEAASVPEQTNPVVEVARIHGELPVPESLGGPRVQGP